MAMLIMCQFSQTFIKNSFVPIAVITAKAFDVPEAVVSTMVFVFLFSSLILSFFIILLTNKIGLRKSIILGSVCQIAGVWIRYLSLQVFDNFWVALVGQALASVANPIYNNMPNRFVTKWFPENEQTIGIFAIQMSNVVAGIISILVGPVFVSDDGGNDLEETKAEINFY